MAEERDDAGEKELDATPHKLEKAREQGDVPRSQEIGAALALIILTGMVNGGGRMLAEPMIEMVHELYSLRALETFQAGGSIAPVVVRTILKVVLPLLGALATAGLVLNLAELGFSIPSGEESGIKLDLNRLNPISNFKQRYGLKVVLDSLKNVAKLILVSSTLVYSASQIFERTAGFLNLTPFDLGATIGANIGQLLFRISLVAILIAVVDYAFERFRFMRKMRMSRQDVKDEHKQAEGDPQIKGARRRRQREIAMGQPIASVEQATVLVANPTHFSVTLRYTRGEDAAPVVLGKGKDLIALKMREKAREHGVPIVENKPLARALFAVAKEGQPIPTDFFRAVAEVLAYVMAPPGSGARPPAPAEIPESAKEAVRRLGGEA